MTEMVLPDGRTLAYRDRGKGPALLLIHGWAMSSVVFSELAQILESDFRVLSPDLRGHGSSGDGQGYDLDSLAGDLRVWIEALGLEEFSLAGWSLGGQVALKLYKALPRQVKNLVLISSTPRFCAGPDWNEGLPETQVRAMSRGIKRDYLKTMSEFFDLQFAGENLDPQRRREILRFAVRQGRLPVPEVAAEALQTLGREDLRADLSSIDTPTLIIHGEFDRITLPGAGRFLAQSIPGGRLRMLSGVGHAPFLSAPIPVADMLNEFCR